MPPHPQRTEFFQPKITLSEYAQTSRSRQDSSENTTLARLLCVECAQSRHAGAIFPPQISVTVRERSDRISPYCCQISLRDCFRFRANAAARSRRLLPASHQCGYTTGIDPLKRKERRVDARAAASHWPGDGNDDRRALQSVPTRGGHGSCHNSDNLRTSVRAARHQPRQGAVRTKAPNHPPFGTKTPGTGPGEHIDRTARLRPARAPRRPRPPRGSARRPRSCNRRSGPPASPRRPSRSASTARTLRAPRA